MSASDFFFFFSFWSHCAPIKGPLFSSVSCPDDENIYAASFQREGFY